MPDRDKQLKRQASSVDLESSRDLESSQELFPDDLSQNNLSQSLFTSPPGGSLESAEASTSRSTQAETTPSNQAQISMPVRTNQAQTPSHSQPYAPVPSHSGGKTTGNTGNKVS